ncbi:hypothetical protein Tco_1574080 [Tanacetum coccineum]
MYTQPQLQTQHSRLFTELLNSDYQIQQLQQSCRGDALRKKPHDDHQDDDQHEEEKANRPHIKGDDNAHIVYVFSRVIRTFEKDDE